MRVRNLARLLPRELYHEAQSAIGPSCELGELLEVGQLEA